MRTEKNIETGRRLRKAMEDKNIKAITLSEKSGVNKGSISQYLSGMYSPNNINAKKLGSVLEVSPLWLMGFDMITVEKAGKYDKKERMDYYFTLLNKEDQDKVLEYAEMLINKYGDTK